MSQTMKHDTPIEIVEQGEKMTWSTFIERNRPFISDEAYSNMLSALSEGRSYVYEAGNVRLTIRLAK